MSWANHAKQKLLLGESATIKPRGNSMRGKIKSGSYITVFPCNDEELKKNDIVLVNVKGKDYLHLIKAVKGKRFLIGNNRGGINGWVGRSSIYGIVKE